VFVPSCPESGVVDAVSTCNITTALPVTVNSRWELPTLGLKQLVPRPTSATPNNSPGGISPFPAYDCTSLSFNHPDWVLDNFSYKRGPAPLDPDLKSTSMKFTLLSRAAGAEGLCKWEGARINDWLNGDRGRMLLVCDII
jgi:hypothetical protein